MFSKTEGGSVTIPHPDEINKAIAAKVKEAQDLKKFLKLAYTAHGVTPPPKKVREPKAAA